MTVGLLHALNDLLYELMRVDNVRRIHCDLTLLSILEELLEVCAALHAVLVVRVTKIVSAPDADNILLVPRLVQQCLHVLLEATPRHSRRLN